MVIRGWLLALTLLPAGLAAADAAPAGDWSAVLGAQPARPLLRQVVIERRADDWLLAHRDRALAALRAGTLDSSVAIYACEVFLARAELTYDEALELHAFLWRTHHPRDRSLADQVIRQWMSWLPPGVEADAVQARMAAHGLPFTREQVAAWLKPLAEGFAAQRAAGLPVAARRDVLVPPGTIFGQTVAIDFRLTVNR